MSPDSEQTVTADIQPQEIARGKLESLEDGRIVLRVPGTEYRLHLVLDAPSGSINTPVGKRIKGTIDARALRLHSFEGGGTFIEPVWGEPRIIAGHVLDHDTTGNRLLLQAAVPIWVELESSQNPTEFPKHQMVTFYVESGTTFTPLDDRESSNP